METKIIKIKPKDIVLLELNARYMENEEYSKLVSNIKRDNKLTSVPFCCMNDNGKIEVLSGNHRVMAAVDANLSEIEVMLCVEKLSKDQKLALQLSHNSIVGKDDDEILKKLYKQIESFDYKEYSGLTDEFIAFCNEQEKLLNSPNLKYQILNLVFMPSEIEEISSVLNEIESYVDKNNFICANINDYDKFLECTTNMSKCLCVKNSSTVFLAIVKLAQKHISELKEICLQDTTGCEYIPIAALINRSDIKKEYATKLDKAIETMLSRGEIKKNEKDKVFEVLADRYLSN